MIRISHSCVIGAIFAASLAGCGDDNQKSVYTKSSPVIVPAGEKLSDKEQRVKSSTGVTAPPTNYPNRR
jgi:hypothetical protein